MTPTDDSTPEGTPTLTVTEGVATIRLRRPSQRNSLSDDDLQTLERHVATVDADPAVHVLVLAADTAAQIRPVFCAGYQLGGFDSGRHGPRHFERVVDALEAARPVTVCALNGSVYGGATDLVLACDLRVALAGSEWRMPANALGLHYYPNGLRRYVACLGLNLARRAFLTAQPLPVEALQAASLFVQVCERDAFDAAVQALVAQVATLAPLSTAGTKRSLAEIGAGHFDVAALRDREALALASADFSEGRAAFAERRAPRFEGR
jgi:enoyl-CoA hydratase/carnithine racemase